MVSFNDNQVLALMRQSDKARSDYAMAKRKGIHKRNVVGVPSLGANPDYHYRHDGDHLWMSEMAWELYRNNMVIGSIVDRAIDNRLQGGFTYDPNTGDKKLDTDIKSWLAEICNDPREVDVNGELTFSEVEETIERAVTVPGDIIVLPVDDGTVELVEGHRLRSPSRPIREKPVHGIEYVPGTFRRSAYWILKNSNNPYTQSIVKSDLTPYLAWNDDGERNVWHVRNTKRTNQSRGITALAPIFDVAGYHDDCQFLKMVQQRAASLFVFVEQLSSDFDLSLLESTTLGTDVSEERKRRAEEYKHNEQQFREVSAGSKLTSRPGAKIEPWSSNIPNNEFFAHAKMLLSFIGINLGMPLVMAMMDASETNFSGYRGAVDQARLSFRRQQQRLISQFHNNWIRFKILKRAETDPAFARQVNKSGSAKIQIFRGRWRPPSWPYIEPTKDATSELIRSANTLTSPRRAKAERGEDVDEIYAETIEDRANGYDGAIAKAKELIDRHDLSVDPWSLALHLLPLPTADRTQVSVTSSRVENEDTNDQNA